jgi:purine-binding chemotaxis protein CheW
MAVASELDSVYYEEDTQKGKYLTFALGVEQYAIEIRHVVDIIGIQDITEVPNQPEYIMGVINLRGKIIPTMDVRKRFNKKFLDYNDRTCIIVVELKSISVGLIVVTVLEVIAIPDEQIAEPPTFNSDFKNKFILGIGKIQSEIVIILDSDKLLNEGEIDEVRNIN